MDPPSPRELVLDGYRSTSEALLGSKSLAYLPFEVPAGVTSIEIVTEIFDREGDRDTVDLGLFDPGGLDESGFRGWQGGTRLPAVLTGSFDSSSPWLVAGPIPAGRWHLAQSYLSASSKGLRYRYTLRLRFDGIPPPQEIPDVPIAQARIRGAGRFVGALHVHSQASDGAFSLIELAERHRRAGFDFLAITDHNNPAAHWQIATAASAVSELTILPGIELTTPTGHATMIGTTPGRWIDHRIDSGDRRLPRHFERAHGENALVVIAHPFANCLSCGWRFPPDEWQDADGIEVWNGPWDETDEAALAWWDGMLREGRRLWAYGGSDFHRDGNPLGPAVILNADSTNEPDLVRALRSGGFVVARDPVGIDLGVRVEENADGPRTLTVRHTVAENGSLSFLNESGFIERRSATGGETTFSLAANSRYARFELRDEDGAMLALSNPVWF